MANYTIHEILQFTCKELLCKSIPNFLGITDVQTKSSTVESNFKFTLTVTGKVKMSDLIMKEYIVIYKKMGERSDLFARAETITAESWEEAERRATARAIHIEYVSDITELGERND